ncbi:MAG: phytanoyl-CoA dioxygenase family protein [Verrucomicrobiae bacterium]|nr:phytanoyl-CoA dioxygenase family protein [Verrucomicrobiae bacterium]MDW8343520.1 phytanoyl-CoA dioxygenase family protein [Verrucomicrobiae bacterium]
MSTTVAEPQLLSREQIAFYHREGYLIVPQVFSPDEVQAIANHFDGLIQGRWSIPPEYQNHWVPETDSPDMWRRYPRVMFPHRFDALSKRMLLHPRVHVILRQLLNDEPIAAQSMFYFKAPGSRGQALHQDNFYLQVEPHTCIAAWTAIDPATKENGGLWVVPNTQDHEIVCPEVADEKESAFRDFVRPPPGKKAIPTHLNPGDTLFFNGNVIHGSGPNRHPTLWRRSFICHYFPASARCINRGYFPLLNFNGDEVSYEASTSGGPCGVEHAALSYGA